jgi:hypothetical protein
MEFGFFRQNFEKIIKFHQNPSRGSRFVSYGHDEAISRFSQFFEWAQEHINTLWGRTGRKICEY